MGSEQVALALPLPTTAAGCARGGGYHRSWWLVAADGRLGSRYYSCFMDCSCASERVLCGHPHTVHTEGSTSTSIRCQLSVKYGIRTGEYMYPHSLERWVLSLARAPCVPRGVRSAPCYPYALLTPPPQRGPREAACVEAGAWCTDRVRGPPWQVYDRVQPVHTHQPRHAADASPLKPADQGVRRYGVGRPPARQVRPSRAGTEALMKNVASCGRRTPATLYPALTVGPQM
jgi:hypothetical protein